jgi:hypothetical protein
MTLNPTLRKAQCVNGHHLQWHNATVADAAFLLALRTDATKGQHLSATAPLLAQQEQYLESYAQRQDQAYFIIKHRETQERVGCVRLYDPQGPSVCWGSWILKAGAPSYCAIESACMVYRYALALGFSAAHFDVRKANASVWKFHERFGAVRTRETELDYWYTLGQEAIEASLLKYHKFLPLPLQVEGLGL